MKKKLLCSIIVGILTLGIAGCSGSKVAVATTQGTTQATTQKATEVKKEAFVAKNTIEFKPVFADLGKVSTATVFDYKNGVLTINSKAKDLEGTADTAAFAYVEANGENFEMVARIVSESAELSTPNVGLMIRDTLDAGSKYSMFGMSGIKAQTYARSFANGKTDVLNVEPDIDKEGKAFAEGVTTVVEGGKFNLNSGEIVNGKMEGGKVTITAPTKITTTIKYTYPLWIKYVKEGKAMTGYVSKDGKEWVKKVQGISKTEDGKVYVGLAAAIGTKTKEDAKDTTIVVDNISIKN